MQLSIKIVFNDKLAPSNPQVSPCHCRLNWYTWHKSVWETMHFFILICLFCLCLSYKQPADSRKHWINVTKKTQKTDLNGVPCPQLAMDGTHYVISMLPYEKHRMDLSACISL